MNRHASLVVSDRPQTQRTGRLQAIGAVTALSVLSSCFAPSVELLGVGSVPGAASDGLDLVPAVLEDGTPHDRLGGFGSGIAYTGIGSRYVATPDRGPSGKTSYANRFYTFDIVAEKGDVRVRLVGAKTLRNRLDQPFVGTESVFDSKDPVANRALDPEAIRVSDRGTFFLADEYGPVVAEFDFEGKELRVLPMPSKFVGASNSARTGEPDDRAGKVGNSRDQEPRDRAVGRQPNRGAEGLAISADGKRIYAIVQSPLHQDGALDAQGEAAGVNDRIVEIDLASGKTREFVYQLDTKKNGVNEIVAVGDDQFLVLERDSEGSSTTAFAKIFKIAIGGATDVSGVERLGTRTLPAGVRPVDKRLFIDLRDRRFGLLDAACPAKAEGLAFGPDLADGRHLLLVSCDNDFLASTDTKILAFAIAPRALPAFARQPQAVRAAASKGSASSSLVQ